MRPPRILIVDDEPGIRQSLRGVLEDDGFAVEAAENGEMTPRQVREYIREQRMTWFEREVKHLRYGEALEVLEKANPDEERILMRAIHAKLANLPKQRRQAEIEKAEEAAQ